MAVRKNFNFVTTPYRKSLVLVSETPFHNISLILQTCVALILKNREALFYKRTDKNKGLFTQLFLIVQLHNTSWTNTWWARCGLSVSADERNSFPVSDINTSIIRSLRLFYCITTLVKCSCFDVCWSFGVAGWLGRYPCGRLQPATRIPPQPSHTETPTHIETRTYNQCGDTIEKSQVPDDGCINVRNMLSIEEVK